MTQRPVQERPVHARGREMKRFFKPVARRLPNPHGDLVKLVARPTISIKQARRGCYVKGKTKAGVPESLY